MSFKQTLENNPFAALAVAAIAAFAAGWAAHVAVIQQSNYETVPRGTYVLKEDINSGSSKLYVTRIELDNAVKQAVANATKLTEKDTSGLSKQLTDANAALAACRAEAKTQANGLASKLQATESALSAAQSRKCPDVIADNFYTLPMLGNFDGSVCLADAAQAASKLGGSARRVDNSVQITQGLGTPEGSFCVVACYQGLVAITCNSLNNKVSVGLTTQIRNYMTLK